MPLRVGSSAVTLKLGSQSVTGRLGAVLVTATVPGAPTITSTADANPVVWDAPASDGGSPITGYRVYVNGTLSEDYGDGEMRSSVDFVSTGQVVEVSAVNAVGEGPKSAPVTVS